ncbi:MAG: UrcA family protein [Allosphingosinicella sp.]|uniref:UrcA family protein n=1 Tax=Allosphingosinicella sp. TaxID=2823234 RepID=UPI00392C1839
MRRSGVLMCVLPAVVALSPAQAGELQRHQFRIVVPSADLQPADPAAARRVAARIDRTVLEGCGAARTAWPTLKRAVRRSPCWRDSMDEIRRRLTHPLLIAAIDDLL